MKRLDCKICVTGLPAGSLVLIPNRYPGGKDPTVTLGEVVNFCPQSRNENGFLKDAVYTVKPFPTSYDRQANGLFYGTWPIAPEQILKIISQPE